MTSGSEINAPIAGIEAAIGSAFQALDQDKGDFLRAANGNFIILRAQNDSSAEDLIIKLAQVHPARFFIVTLDDSVAQLNAQVAAQCHLVAGGVSVCSEVVRIGLPRAALAALPSVIRANRLPGKTSELLVFGGNIKQSEIALLLPLVDDLIFDSAARSGVCDAYALSQNLHSTIDVAWLQLAEWRDHVRALFDRAAAQALLGSLSKLLIECGVIDKIPNPAALLMAGFLIDRLGLRLVRSNKSTVELATLDNATVELEFVETKIKLACGVKALCFFGSGKDRIECSRAEETFESQVSVGNEQLRTSNPATNEGVEAALFRYYGIGVSLGNYPAALARAVMLEKELRKSAPAEGRV